MNILNIEQQLSLLQSVGYTLNIDEKIKLKLAHIKLMESHPQLDQVKFWGKVEGITKNYYIMLGLKYRESYEFPHKYFFWASQDFQFKELPELLPQHQGICENHNALFSGDPAKILVNVEGDGEGEGNENQPDPENQGQKKQQQQDEEKEKVPPKKNFTQLSRLSHVVRAIDNDVQCVPKGSYFMTPQHQLAPTQKFYGLNEDNCQDLSSWLHFRSPQSEESRKKIEDCNVVFCDDFLDSLEEDNPKGVWSIQMDCEKRNVNCRNLLWPGYYSFHGIKTNHFGGVYLGNGVKNIDVAFMI